MRLFFPGGEHPEVELRSGETRIGFAADGRVRVGADVDERRRVSVFRGPLGLWLHASEPSLCHVNGRPIQELACLRLGDLLSVGAVRVRLRSSRIPGVPVVGPATNPRPEVGGCPSIPPRRALRGLSGGHSGRTFPIPQTLWIGSDRHCGIVLDEPSIPARWLRLEPDGHGLIVRSGTPQAGVEVNGWRVEIARLCGGDQLVCAGHRFQVELPEPAEDGHPSQQAGHGEAGVRSDARSTSGPDAEHEGDRSSRPRDGLDAGWWLVIAAATFAALTTLLLL